MCIISIEGTLELVSSEGVSNDREVYFVTQLAVVLTTINNATSLGGVMTIGLLATQGTAQYLEQD
ncbi:hypothetical protein K7432_007765 [Basidiobolus ranarum]|uniref:Uncharacterized protein n=1 Tax=Basidiobolus ranarum TaxID=34480 RepID=A0ABR2VZV8_9FUNG